MVPRSCQFLIAAASLLVPPGLRADWKREWHAELWHRAEAGTPPDELLQCARGAFRDAAWFRSSEYARSDLAEDRFFVKLFRLEFTVLGVALLLCLWAGVWWYPALPYDDAGRLVRFERNVRFLGAVDSIFSQMLLKHLEGARVLQEIATYRIFLGVMPGARVSSNFFDVLGVQPAQGRTFRDADLETVTVITDDLWRRFHRDPDMIGKTIRLPYGKYTVIGILPRGFWFSNDRLWYYTAMPKSSRFYSAIARMKPGSTLLSTREDARRISGKVELAWMTKSLEILPIFDDPRRQEASFAIIIATIGAAFGLLFLMIRGLGGAVYRLLLSARLFVLLLGFSAMWVALVRSSPGLRGPFSFFQLWIFLLACSAASFLIVRDHAARCLVCCRRLRLPAPIGVWSSPILDQPGTEYVCPDGHGMLYIAETRNDTDYWTGLDESWQDLFVHTHR